MISFHSYISEKCNRNENNRRSASIFNRLPISILDKGKFLNVQLLIYQKCLRGGRDRNYVWQRSAVARKCFNGRKFIKLTEEN